MSFINELMDEITADEGKKLQSYKCSEDKLTIGIGHLVLPDEDLYRQPIGTTITEAQCKSLFNNDIKIVIDEVGDVFPTYESLPTEVQKILCNMLFQLGKPKLSRFFLLRKAIAERKWEEAGNQMYQSKWRRQTPNRANRLIKRMKTVVD